jgi:hypothetical protein
MGEINAVSYRICLCVCGIFVPDDRPQEAYAHFNLHVNFFFFSHTSFTSAKTLCHREDPTFLHVHIQAVPYLTKFAVPNIMLSDGGKREWRLPILACFVGSICIPCPAAAAFARPPPYLDSLLTQYSRDHAPLTSYVAELVSALRAMDEDLVNATSPITRAVGSRTIPDHPIGFSILPEYVRAVVPAKGHGLATVIPGAQPCVGSVAARVI